MERQHVYHTINSRHSKHSEWLYSFFIDFVIMFSGGSMCVKVSACSVAAARYSNGHNTSMASKTMPSPQ
jgi:prephenate dehydratase